MEVRRDPRSILFILILLLLIHSPEQPGQQPYNLRNRYDEVIGHEWDELDILNRTRYGDFDARNNKWLNISGLNEEDGFVWELLNPVKQRAAARVKDSLGDVAEGLLDGTAEDTARLPMYRNISGYVQGEWIRSPLARIRTPSDVNSSASIDNPFPMAEYDRNLTGASGHVRIHLTELDERMRTDENKTVSEVSARIIIGDDDSMGDNWWEFVLHGVHYPNLGGSVLTTTSEKFGGIFALPHFQLSQNLYTKSKELLSGSIHDTIDRQANRIYPIWNPWSSVEGTSEAGFSSPHCEMVLYLQQHPIQVQSQAAQQPLQNSLEMDWLEQELRYPTGASLPRRSPLTMSMVGFSPDCGFVIESKGPPDQPPSEYSHLIGSKTEEYNDRARRDIIAFAITLFIQLNLLIRQLKETATPSTRNRVSFYTIAMLAMGDGFAFITLVFMHLLIGTSQLPLYATAFLALFSVVLELRFLMDIWSVQATEQLRQEREQSTNSPPSQTTPTPPAQTTPSPSPESGGLPPPATAARPRAATPVIVAPDQDDAEENANGGGTAGRTTPGRAELGSLYSRYCFLLGVISFLTWNISFARATVQAFYFDMLYFVYLSFWCPQIYRNVMRNCRKALRWDFVLGQSAVRLLPIAYFYGASDNVLFFRTDLKALCVLGGWVWIQILALASQEMLGSRFFIREGWAPPAYDYHRILREDEEEATMPIGSAQSPTDDGQDQSQSLSKAGESRGKGMKVFDCSICAGDIEVPVIPRGAAGDTPGIGGGLLQRRAYMVTPCRHIFHTPCLEGWMRYRLQCPNCREILPPL